MLYGCDKISSMKKVKSKIGETTLNDVLEAVQVGFTKVENRLDGVENRLDGVENKLDGVENRLGEVEYRMTALEKRTGSLENTVEDMKDTLNGVARAVDKDSLVIMNHERRIRHLEKSNV